MSNGEAKVEDGVKVGKEEDATERDTADKVVAEDTGQNGKLNEGGKDGTTEFKDMDASSNEGVENGDDESLERKHKDAQSIDSGHEEEKRAENGKNGVGVRIPNGKDDGEVFVNGDENAKEIDPFIIVDVGPDGTIITEKGVPLASPEEEKRKQRHRIAHTVCVFGSAFTMGWVFALLGPTFPDLRMLIDEDLTTASWIFTAWSFGFLVGSISSGIAYDRFHKLRLLVSLNLFLAASLVITPFCSSLFTMLVVMVGYGIGSGSIVTASTTDITFVWRDKARSFMQALAAIICVGAIISPIASDPFLAKAVQVLQPQQSVELVTVATLSRAAEAENVTVAAGYEIENGVDAVQPDVVMYGETHVHVAYFLAAFVAIASASMYVIVYFIFGDVYTKALVQPTIADGAAADTKIYILCRKHQNVFTALLALSMLIYRMGEAAITNFLMTFVIGALDWSKTEGSSLASVYFLTTCIGRFASVFIVKKLSIEAIFAVFMIIQLVGGIMIWAAVGLGQNILVWGAIGVIGFGMAPIFGTTFSFMSEKVRPLTGRVSAMFFMGNGIGSMICPVLLGALMDHVSQLWFIYYSVIMYVLCIVCMTFIVVFYRHLQNKTTSSATST